MTYQIGRFLKGRDLYPPELNWVQVWCEGKERPYIPPKAIENVLVWPVGLNRERRQKARAALVEFLAGLYRGERGAERYIERLQPEWSRMGWGGVIGAGADLRLPPR